MFLLRFGFVAGSFLRMKVDDKDEGRLIIYTIPSSLNDNFRIRNTGTDGRRYLERDQGSSWELLGCRPKQEAVCN